jgi:hypothetical protein
VYTETPAKPFLVWGESCVFAGKAFEGCAVALSVAQWVGFLIHTMGVDGRKETRGNDNSEA